ncbi:hypothetical protein BH23CHL6_BH23CHL6_12010 [soil metagenome]
MLPMRTPNNRTFLSLILAAAGAVLLAGCAGAEAGPGWTFAPLVPTPPAEESPAGSPDGSPGGSPGGSPDGSPDCSPGTALQVSTPEDQPLAFVPDVLSAPPATDVTVEYLNDSALQHNIHFFAGPDAGSPSIAATELVTGPGAPESVSFTTPEEAGQYFFHCDVHPQQMVGTLEVGP